ncbi:ATP-binding protein [Ichthyenterobacterium sp. W332]|uniref:histidine kinase n=1 Tax=Microcosmobacter mediterraneus TaxID=3075607 RepID=A0ABU2YMH2_9FLAO|nr:ATP-binding protein [Ichthyenterobacterium sp. W332]MDT0559007.1 ATP-binding protein [Ichthyenterobacterium sp. W332]
MNDKRYHWILYTIVAVIIATIGIQVYWNYKNYQTNKQQLINDVQTSLDKAVDDYYTNLAEKTTLGLSLSGSRQKNLLSKGGLLDQLTAQIDESNQIISDIELHPDSLEGITILRGFKADSMMKQQQKDSKSMHLDSFSAEIKSFKAENDSINLTEFEFLTSKVMISISNDSINIKEVDSLVNSELLRKNIDVDFSIHYLNTNDSLNKVKALKSFITSKGIDDGKVLLTTFSKSSLLPQNCQLGITFTNQTRLVLKRILSGILLSTLLVLAVISCLFYLLKIIKHQKQLAEVKNDLISNITHEFKTPIATIGVALESIKDFNVIEDKEKTKTYLDMSNQQLGKLNTMVEKLLETATLDSESLELSKEPININDLVNSVVKKFQLQDNSKQLTFNSNNEHTIINVDAFHLENAINNIVDNAIKYGGNLIDVSVFEKNKRITIEISDNGNTLTNSNKDKIFQKFYRVPKGNTHDVKGFGIGLYYTKKIIDKHNGTITLHLSNSKTCFKISLPNA